LDRQVEDAIEFLCKYEKELLNLVAEYKVDDIRLDFPLDSRLREGDDGIVAQFEYLPPELLKLAENIGIGIELSYYLS
jgi:hypothetical protein